MISPVSLLRAVAKTFFGYWWRARLRALVLCWPISKLANIAYRVLWKKSVLFLVLLAGVDSLLASTLGRGVASASLISWNYMFRAATHGERRGGAALGTSGAAAWAVGTFGDRFGGVLSGSLSLEVHLFLRCSREWVETYQAAWPPFEVV